LITKVLLRSFFTNIVLSFIKIIFGFLGNSGALIADGIHSLSDTMTDVFSMIGSRLSLKPADEKHPFGHGKIEYITCIFIGIVITIMGASIIYDAFTASVTIPTLYVAILCLIVILAKLLLSKYILKKGEEYNSNILIASGKESFSDVISSSVVFVSILVSQLGEINSIFAYADRLAMVLVGILILKIAYNIFKENFNGLLGEQIIDDEYINKIKKIISAEKKVKKIDSLVILKYGSIYQITCEVSMDGNIILEKAHDTLEIIEHKIKEYDERIKHIIIHINPYKNNWHDKLKVIKSIYKSVKKTSNISIYSVES